MKEDYMKTPNTIKGISVVGLIAIVLLPIVFVSGCNYGPSPEFVAKMQRRAQDHFPKYKQLIKESSDIQLEKMHGLQEGDISKTGSGPAIRNSMQKAIDAWKFEIDENAKLIESDQK